MEISNSSRLTYQFIGEDDNAFLFQLDQDPAVMRFINGGKPTSKEDITSKFMPRLYAYRNADKGWGLWKVTVQDTQQEIGWILARPMEFFSDSPLYDDVELGWRFVQSSWGKGYATEAAKHVKNTLSTLPQNKHFSAIAVKENYGSIRVMKNLGMSYIKTYLHSDSQLGELEVVLYSMENS